MTVKNGAQYAATSNWEFICENYAYTGNLNAQIGKTENGGILKLSVLTTGSNLYIGGTVYLFLSDFSIITCTDKGIKEFKDNKAISYYNLTLPEINRLKNNIITDIRFAIKGNHTTFSSQIGNFTAINKIKYFAPYDKSIRNTFETELQIRSLYL